MPTLRRLLKAALGRNEFRYLIVAGSVSVGYICLLAGLLALQLQYMIAILIAQVITITIAFPLYRRFVFLSHGLWYKDFWRFLTVWSSGAIAGFVATPFLVEVFGVRPLIAQIGSIIVIAVCSYLGHRFFSFAQRKDSGEAQTSGGAGGRQ